MHRFFFCSEKTLKTNLQNYDISINEPPYNLNNILLLNLIISLAIGLFIFKLQPFLDRKINTYLFRKALSYDIKHKKLTLHFQPIINVKLNQVEKFETLIRWKSDKYGSVNADKIIQGCIENHEINRLTDLVFDLLAESTLFNSKACENIHFSVNIERESIIDTHYCTKLIDRIRLIGQRVDIEITENIEIQERYIASFKENIASIHHAGIDISVDDFGKAFASFDLLTNIKFDALKLDKAFVKDINTDPKKCKIIESIVNLSDELSFDIVVEGIEEQEQLDAFSNLRIYLIQGYFFAKPMPDKDALNWLESFNTQANTQS